MTVRSIKKEFLNLYGENKNFDRIYGLTMSAPLKLIVCVYDSKQAKKDLPKRVGLDLEFLEVDKPKKSQEKT